MWPLITNFSSLSNFSPQVGVALIKLSSLFSAASALHVQKLTIVSWIAYRWLCESMRFGVIPSSTPLCLSPLLLFPPLKSSAVNGQLTITTLPDILFLTNNGVHNIAPQSAIWLYCTVNSATAAPSITWTKDGVTLVNDPPHIRIRSSNDTLLSATSSLVVDNFGIADDGGSYVCQASDGTATMSSSAVSLTGRSCWFQYQQRDLCQ